ncbi:803_t:CDS:2, partial [Funneliformis geosporum]
PEAEEVKFNDADLDKFIQKLNLKQLKRFEPLKDKDIKKFYDFAGPDFTWPSTSNINECCAIYDYITDSDPRFQEGQGEEIAINRLAYCRLIESGSLDSSKGNYVHIEHEKLVGYGTKLSVKKYKELINKNSGMLYSPIEQEVVKIRFSSTANVNLKEWQKKIDHSGATVTIIPYFIRMKMKYDYGWNTTPSSLNGFGSDLDVLRIPNNTIDCGLVGFDVLNAVR